MSEKAIVLRTPRLRLRTFRDSDVDLRVDVASNPEFLKEEAAVADCMKPDRIVIGTQNAKTEALLREVYAPFNRNHDKVVAMDLRVPS